MVFSSPIFLFFFLPLSLAIGLLLPNTKAKNGWLLLTSLLFYVWGETSFIVLLLGSTLINYLLALAIERSAIHSRRKTIVVLAIIINIGLLAFFKYADFFAKQLNVVLHFFGAPAISFPPIPLPIGISFFTFHALSYVIDVYRGKWSAAKTPQDTALYIFFFPQLVAGPILRWCTIGPQLVHHPSTANLFADGIRRFVGGLAKKMLIANAVARGADQIFALPSNELSGPVAWLGIVCYTLQIYFDFSGYSDMAIGLGKMFGFEFPENFQFPYTAKSIQDFWRRWHISLSSWFRDYVYIPLGGNRVSEKRTYVNLIVVFFLCGLWHGANWTFVLWGLYHGFFLILERTRFGAIQDSMETAVRRIYTLLVVMGGWVLFRAETAMEAMNYFKALLGLGSANLAQPVARYATSEVMLAIFFGVVFCGPAWNWLRTKATMMIVRIPAPYRHLTFVSLATAEIVVIASLFILSSAWLARGTYNPFIYFRF